MEFIDFDTYLLASATAINKSSQCLWRGHASDGKELRCSNRRLVHPSRLVKSPFGADVPDVLLYCNYHSRECIANHSERKNVLVPNELSYCTECYYLMMNRRPRSLTALTVPGVFVFDESLLKRRKRHTILNYNDALNQDSVCSWRSADKLFRGYRCSNLVLCDPATKEYLTTCGYHVTRCPRLHVNKRDCVIKVPNELGLCPQHFQQETGRLPELVEWPLPGMFKTHERKYVRCNSIHWAAPQWPPRPDFYIDRVDSPYESEEAASPYQTNFSKRDDSIFRDANAITSGSLIRNAPSQGSLKLMKQSKKTMKLQQMGIVPDILIPFPPFLSQCLRLGIFHQETVNQGANSIRNFSKSTRSIRNFFKGGGILVNNAATIIQKMWRGYNKRLIHKRVFFDAQIIRRIHAATLIQAKVRSLLVRKHLGHILFGFTREATRIQTVVRAFLAKRFIQKLRAAHKIKAFFRECRKKFLWQGVLMVINLRIQFRRNDPHSTTIQKLFRGYSVRNHKFTHEIKKLQYERSHRTIVNFLTKLFLSRRNKKARECDILVVKMQSSILARRIHRLYVKYKVQKDFSAMINKTVQQLQKHIRGFLGRLFTRKLKTARDYFRKWMAPVYATRSIEELYSGKKWELLTTNTLVSFTSSNSSSETKVADEISPPLRKFLPHRFHSFDEIEKTMFFSILQKWYKEKSYPMLTKEAECLIQRFKNPDNSNVYIKSVEDYMSLHQKPCRRHGRWLCGTCTFRRECMIQKCGCMCFMKSDNKDNAGMCEKCNHVAQNHRLCPLQLQTSNTKASMLAILNEPRNPDMSVPFSVKGLYSEKAVNFEDKIIVGHRLRGSSKVAPHHKCSIRGTFEEDINIGSMVIGDACWSANAKYSVNRAHRFEGGDIKMIQDVQMSKRTPNTAVGSVQFWSTVVRKNPNKVNHQIA